MLCPNAGFPGQTPASPALTSVLEDGSRHKMQLVTGERPRERGSGSCRGQARFSQQAAVAAP